MKEEGVGLPSKELRAILITGQEVDKRHEFEEIVGDFPYINEQKQLKMFAELKNVIDQPEGNTILLNPEAFTPQEKSLTFQRRSWMMPQDLHEDVHCQKC